MESLGGAAASAFPNRDLLIRRPALITTPRTINADEVLIELRPNRYAVVLTGGLHLLEIHDHRRAVHAGEEMPAEGSVLLGGHFAEVVLLDTLPDVRIATPHIGCYKPEAPLGLLGHYLCSFRERNVAFKWRQPPRKSLSFL